MTQDSVKFSYNIRIKKTGERPGTKKPILYNCVFPRNEAAKYLLKDVVNFFLKTKVVKSFINNSEHSKIILYNSSVGRRFISKKRCEFFWIGKFPNFPIQALVFVLAIMQFFQQRNFQQYNNGNLVMANISNMAKIIMAIFSRKCKGITYWAKICRYGYIKNAQLWLYALWFFFS